MAPATIHVTLKHSVEVEVFNSQPVPCILLRVYGNSRRRGSPRRKVILLAPCPFGRPDHAQVIVGDLEPGLKLDDREELSLLAAVVGIGTRLGRKELVSRLDPSSRHAEHWMVDTTRGVAVRANVSVPSVTAVRFVVGGEFHVGRVASLESEIIPLERKRVDENQGIITRARGTADGSEGARECVIGLDAGQ